MRHSFLIFALLLLFGIAARAQSLTPVAQASTGTPNNASQGSADTELLQLQQAEVTKLSASLDQLKQLYNEGLIARVELDKAEADLKTAQAKVETTKNQIANAEKLAAEARKLAAMPKSKSLIKPTLLSVGSTVGSWSLSNLSSVQQFFQRTFGRPLPTSAVGQSATHDRLGWDHRNSVDVGLDPDSTEGGALIKYLKQVGIPFLAFRSAIPGIATGPHIHIGFPSHRLA